MATQAQIAAVQQLYVGYLGRAADSAGQQFWANAIANGTATIASVATGFTLSNEYKATYGGLSTSDLVEQVYNNVLGRAPDADGKAFWVAALANGTVTADTLVATIVTNLGALDQQTINNKVFVAQTYTDTAGASYNVDAGTASIVGVDSTAASVAAATAKIANGSLPGQVPALALINAADAAVADRVAYETANKAAVDKIAADLKLTVADGTAFKTELADVVKASTDARALNVNGGTDTTTVLTTKASDAAAKTAADYAALNAAGKAKADAYVAAFKAEAALKAANPADVAGVKAGLAADTKFDSTVIGNAAKVDASIKDAGTLYSFYTNGTTTADQRAAIDTALKDVPYFVTFKATAVVDSAKNVAGQAVIETKAAVDAAGTYSADYLIQAGVEKTLANAKAADAIVTAAKAQADAYAVKTTAEKTATDAVTNFKADGVKLHALDGTDDAGTADAVGTTTKDVFYFADKAVAADPAKDFAITKFAAGDSIVLGSGYSFNSGALSTGDNNKLEFFLVQQGKDTLVVLETTKYGSSDVAKASDGTLVSNSATADHAAIITLTGVTADHVAVNNGVVSYV